MFGFKTYQRDEGEEERKERPHGRIHCMFTLCFGVVDLEDSLEDVEAG